jgi:anaerobic selenocysteine-containing dehydrogenase
VPVPLPDRGVPPGHFAVATRRGKQFNSMVQADRDPLTGARRDDVLVNVVDLRALGMADGDPVVVRSDVGTLAGRARAAPVLPGTLQVHWPEGAVLLDPRRRSPESGVPDYNTVATLEPDPGRPAGGG